MVESQLEFMKTLVLKSHGQKLSCKPIVYKEFGWGDGNHTNYPPTFKQLEDMLSGSGNYSNLTSSNYSSISQYVDDFAWRPLSTRLGFHGMSDYVTQVRTSNKGK